MSILIMSQSASSNIILNESSSCVKNLPPWLWITVCKSLGIKLSENDKPIISSILFVLTYSSALGLVFTTCWFTVYDIISSYTKTTVIDGTVSIIFSAMWCILGLYAHKLSYKLFCHHHFVKLVKLHSKTFLRMNAAVVLFVLMLLFLIVNNINGYISNENGICKKIGVEKVVCNLKFFFRVIFSVCALMWNFLVAFVLTSVCRSHVIRIRKLMRALEYDSREYEFRFLGLKNNAEETQAEQQNLENETTWFEDLDSATETSDEAILFRSSVLEFQNMSTRENQESFPSTSGIDVQVRNEEAKEKACLSNDEILFNFFKIQTDLRTSSIALQRWMISLICLVAIWITLNLVLWLTYDPNLIDLVDFFLPLMFLPLLASAYAEVNQEGQRILLFICLRESRLKLLQVLQNQPLQMTVYNSTLSYQKIATVAFGVLLALASKIIMQKVQT